MTGIIATVLLVGCIGLLIGAFLGVAGEKFKVEVDEKEVQVRGALPGSNCGGCGYPGCDGLAAAIVKKEASSHDCPSGGAEVAKEIAEIMGEDPGAFIRLRASVRCIGGNRRAEVRYRYSGIPDCAMVASVPGGGPKICEYGCVGFGNCKRACPFDAIKIDHGLATIQKDKCKACKRCIKACPKDLIELVPYDNRFKVGCNSRSKAKDVMKACKSGCIGCRKCVKVCEHDAITVKDNLAYIDYDKCKRCGACKESCPRKVISPYFVEVS